MTPVARNVPTTTALVNLFKNRQALLKYLKEDERLTYTVHVNPVTGCVVMTLAYRNHILIKLTQSEENAESWEICYVNVFVQWHTKDGELELPEFLPPDTESHLPF